MEKKNQNHINTAKQIQTSLMCKIDLSILTLNKIIKAMHTQTFNIKDNKDCKKYTMI